MKSKALFGLLANFGGLVVFWSVNLTLGLKPAIAAVMGFVVVDGLRRILLRHPIPRSWLLLNLMALAFGAVDLAARTPFMIRYEAVVTNLIIALVFAVGAWGERPILIEFAEQGRGEPFPTGVPGLYAFMRAFTLVWSAYFIARAAFCWWVVHAFPLNQALAIRAVVGMVSLAALMAISFQGRRIFVFCRRLGLFRGPALAAASGEQA